ncbi:MAG: DUF4175 family protein [Saprospiraceae bacterium]|nr:DUF4175 family protein [Saprospiraceae bacterium]
MQWNQNYYEELIHKVDAFTRKYYINQLIRGSLYFIGLVTVVFVAFNLLEHYFYFSKAVRKILFFSFIGLFGLSLWHWVITPMMHYFKLGKLISQEEAAKIIGTHFSNVKDKLINVLQLKSQSVGYTDRTLIDASIQQKASELKPVPFVAAIDLQKNRKYIQYAILPLFLLGSLWLWSPSLIKDPTTRLIQNDKEFERDALFHFELSAQELKTRQNSDFTIHAKVSGTVMPSEAFIVVDQFPYRMQKISDDEYSYTFNNIQHDTEFKLKSGEIESSAFQLKVIRQAVLEGFDAKLNYPGYTGRKNETLQNTGDLNVPQGTRVDFLWNTINADELKVRWGNQWNNELQRSGENRFQASYRAMKDQSYTLYFKNAEADYYDSVTYSISIIPDQYPEIRVDPFQDSTDTKVVYLAGDASDDYGLNRLEFLYQIKHANGQPEALQKVPVNLQSGLGTNSAFRHVFDMTTLNLLPGDMVSYYFEVWDNDAVNGSKSSKSSMLEFRQRSTEELTKQEEQNNADIKAEMEKSVRDAKKLQQKLADFKNKMLQEKDVQWQNKKDLEKLMKEQEDIQKNFEDAKKKFDDNLKNQNQHSQPDENLLEKQQQLQKMMNESMSDEMKQLIKQIQDLMQELNKDQAVQMSEKFENKTQELTKEMDRLLELFKELELEKTRKDQIDKLRELADEQKKLAEKTEKKEESKENLEKKQDELNKKFDDIQKKQEDIQKKNKELEKPKDIKDRKAESESIKKDMEQSKDKLNKSENSSASEKQKEAANKMEEQAESMEQEMQSGEKEQHEEDIKVIRQLLENLVALSFDQESLIKEMSQTNPQTPHYVSLVQDQFRLKDNFRLIEDTLTELSKRVFEISTYVMDKVDEINDNFKQTINHLEARSVSAASGNQHRVMKNANDLAVMLSETLSNKQKKAAACNKPGNGSCNKPGGTGKKPGKSKSPSDKISQGQTKLGDDMKKLQQKMQNGEGKLSKEFAELAAKQAQLRKMLQELEQEKKERGEGGGQLKDIQNEMNKTEKELVNKQLTNETLKRQQETTTRLLEAERAEREREYKEERKSETGTNIDRKFPPQLEEYIKQRQAETEWFKQVSPDLKPFYKKLVEDYYQSLKSR